MDLFGWGRSSCPITGEPTCRCGDKKVAVERPTIKETLRKLFTDHAVYTKFYIESFLSELDDSKAIVNRLLANQKDIGTYVGDFVGSSKGERLSELLTEHIKRAAIVLACLKSENDVELKRSISSLFENSNETSEFISSLNPSKLPMDVVRREFHMHNQHVIEIATLHFQKRYIEEVKQYDAYYNHMLTFSDSLYNALK